MSSEANLVLHKAHARLRFDVSQNRTRVSMLWISESDTNLFLVLTDKKQQDITD